MTTHLRSGDASAALCEPMLPVTANFEWTSTEPMVLKMILSIEVAESLLHGVESKVSWDFDRALLDAALNEPSQPFGHGDVRVQVIDNCLSFDLRGVAGKMHPVIVELEPARALLIRSYMLVPAGEERLDVDSALLKLLGAS